MATLPKQFAPGWPEENAIYRTARKVYRCHGNGASGDALRHAPSCPGQIVPGTPYVEFVGETPPFQKGSAHSIPCALVFDYIRAANPAPVELPTDAERIAELVDALRPFAEFARQWQRQPMRGMHDVFYAIHTGTDYAAELKHSECTAALVLVDKYETKEG